MKSKKKNVILTTLCSLALIPTINNVKADNINHRSVLSSNSSMVQNTVFNLDDKATIMNYEFNWLKTHQTGLNEKAIVGILAAAEYETSNNPASKKDGKGILAWNESASLNPGNDTKSLDSQLNYLKATLTVHNNKLVKQMNSSKDALDAAIVFEKNYEGNHNFFKGPYKARYKKAIKRLKKDVKVVKAHLNKEGSNTSRNKSSSLSNSTIRANKNFIISYLSKNTNLNKNSIQGICAVIYEKSGFNPDFKSNDCTGLLAWTSKPVPMNNKRNLSKISQQALYLKDTINKRLINNLNSQKTPAEAAEIFSKEYCHDTNANKIDWQKFVKIVGKNL